MKTNTIKNLFNHSDSNYAYSYSSMFFVAVACKLHFDCKVLCSDTFFSNLALLHFHFNCICIILYSIKIIHIKSNEKQSNKKFISNEQIFTCYCSVFIIRWISNLLLFLVKWIHHIDNVNSGNMFDFQPNHFRGTINQFFSKIWIPFLQHIDYLF